jgi:phosphinothricin acetyltransferase
MPAPTKSTDVDKVVCYVTRRRGDALQLLCFDQPDEPDAGTQVPAGTVDPGEAYPAAAARELDEESGLRPHDAPLLGQIDAYGRVNPESGHLHVRRVYHFDGSAVTADAWDHIARGSSDENGRVFRCHWLPLDVARRTLSGDFGRSIDLLLTHFDRKPTHRPATAADLPAINAIYNHYVPRSTCTYQEVEDTLDDRRAWFEAHGPRHPVTALTLGADVVAWGALNVFRARSAYRFSTENSIYVRHDLVGTGLGRIILADQISQARQLGYRTVVAGIDAEQAGSIKLHAGFGFANEAVLRQVGYKFDRWLDVLFMQKLL